VRSASAPAAPTIAATAHRWRAARGELSRRAMSQRAGVGRQRGMQARMTQSVLSVPGALPAMQALAEAVESAGLPKTLLELVHLRASQINGCALCCEMHARYLRRMDTSDARLATVAAWREAPYFSDAERAALALAEEMTRIADRPDAVPDAVWEEATRHFAEPQLAALVLSISIINVWNRLNVATRQVAGTGP